jgi:hypothetical protein
MELDKVKKITDIITEYRKKKVTGKMILEINFNEGGITEIIESFTRRVK